MTTTDYRAMAVAEADRLLGVTYALLDIAQAIREAGKSGGKYASEYADQPERIPEPPARINPDAMVPETGRRP